MVCNRFVEALNSSRIVAVVFFSAAGLVWLGYALGNAAAFGSISGKWTPGWEMLSAIGSIAAASVAVGIALWQNNETRRAERDRSFIVATRIAHPLLEFSKMFQGVVMRWRSDIGTLMGFGTGHLRVKDEVANFLRGSVVSVDDLVQLAAAGSLGGKIANVYSYFKKIDYMFSEMEDSQTRPLFLIGDQERKKQKIIATCGLVSDLLVECASECTRISGESIKSR